MNDQTRPVKVVDGVLLFKIQIQILKIMSLELFKLAPKIPGILRICSETEPPIIKTCRGFLLISLFKLWLHISGICNFDKLNIL
jgi:hypothetical protein